MCVFNCSHAPEGALFFAPRQTPLPEIARYLQRENYLKRDPMGVGCVAQVAQLYRFLKSPEPLLVARRAAPPPLPPPSPRKSPEEARRSRAPLRLAGLEDLH